MPMINSGIQAIFMVRFLVAHPAADRGTGLAHAFFGPLVLAAKLHYTGVCRKFR